MWLDERIIKFGDSLTKNEMDIVEDIKKIDQQMPTYNIVELAEVLHTSKSTILRISQKLGFKGFSEFKYHFSINESTVIFNSRDLKEMMKKDINQTIKLAEATNFQPLIQLIKEARTVYCYGTGNAQKKALEEFARLLLTVDKQVVVVPTSSEFPLLLSMMSKEDILIVCSLSGNTPRIKEVVQTVGSIEIPIIGISHFSQSYLHEKADFMYYYCSSGFYDPVKQKERVSLTGLTILLDWIYREYFLNYMDETID